jgi:hypothetical protein
MRLISVFSHLFTYFMAMKIIIFESNKRKIKLKLPFHQKGTTFDGFHYFLSNEHTVIKPINIFKKLHYVDLSPYLKTFR